MGKFQEESVFKECMWLPIDRDWWMKVLWKRFGGVFQL
jgi:hypothetical protein